MRRGRLFLLLGLVLVILIGAVVILLPRLTASNQPVVEPTPEIPPTPTPEPLNVLIVTQRIARAEVLTEDTVTFVTISRDDPLAGLLITDLTQAIGKRAKYDLEPGVFLTPSMVAGSMEELSSAGSDAALLIPQGSVAVSIPISRLSAVAYGVRKGDHVNVIMTANFLDLDADFQTILPNYSSAIIAPGPSVVLATGEGDAATASITSSELLQILTAQIISGGSVSPIGRIELNNTLGQPFHVVPSETQRPRLVSQTLVQNAVVMMVGTYKTEAQEAYEEEIANIPTPVPAPVEEGAAPAPTATPPPPPAPPDIITIAVSPQDAVAINFAMFSGAQLTLAMRSAGDDVIVPTESVTLQFLLNQYNIPVPQKLPFGFAPRNDEIAQPTLSNDTVVAPAATTP